MMCVRHLPKMPDLHMIRCHLMGARQARTDSHITGGASWSHLELKVLVQCQRCCLDLGGTEWTVKVGVMLTPPHPPPCAQHSFTIRSLPCSMGACRYLGRSVIHSGHLDTHLLGSPPTPVLDSLPIIKVTALCMSKAAETGDGSRYLQVPAGIPAAYGYASRWIHLIVLSPW